ncbi:MAG: hypothetical protein OSJ62_05495 [Lachnospiraceae bacterium]|nr:hypothetical protein [Lachnospiraceae bacterium]
MSILQKAMDLLQTMPEQKIEIVYAYMRFVNTLAEDEEKITKKKSAKSIAGIARQYANPDLISLEKEAFANAMVEKHAID